MSQPMPPDGVPAYDPAGADPAWTPVRQRTGRGPLVLGGVALGPDPVLNEYAQRCFEGDLQACDDLMYESAPLSADEDYAITCGGRVKVYAVVACIDLDEAPAARPTGRAESGAPVRRFRRW